MSCLKCKMIFIQCFLVALIIGISGGDSTGTIIPCKKSDSACITASAQSAFEKFIGGYPDLGVESSDPLPLDVIVGDLSTLKFKFTDSTAVGLKNCKVNENPILDVAGSKLKLSLTCKNIVMRGHYTISGQLIILPVEGEGPFEIICKKYLFTVEADLKQVHGSDGKQHLSVKNFKFTSTPQEPVHFDFQNLFNGQKDLADGVLKFANESWKEVADFVQEPVISALLKKVIKNFNKFLKLVAVDDLYLD